MKTGVIFPSYTAEMTMSAVSGGWSPDFPLQNVFDSVNISKLARATASGNRVFNGTFAAPRTIQAFAVVGHNVRSITTLFELLLYAGDDATGSIVGRTFAQTWHPGPSAYRSVRPFVFASPLINVRSFQLQINDPGVALEIQSIEIGQFWEWPGISYGREIGFRPEEGRVSTAGGASYSTSTARDPRFVSGQVEAMKIAESTTTGLDFQKLNDIQRPFVWAEDFDDPTSWARKCMLVRNEELPPLVGSLYKRDRFPVRLIEHMR